ncbi:oxidoreductase [Parapedobacter tibetensis]|uniref:oxidoreductase n=1 Tax=Parapedobacter tibetensis TaxID=2972951 RepID=UPI00214D85B7|nr:oxidoreductase [Parapedobacter tibetensis]
MQKSAIVFGATGLIGGHLLRYLLDRSTHSKVTAVVRRKVTFNHPKLHQVVADLQTLNEVGDLLVADDVFCCLGTTRKKTPDLNAYYQIDHDYPVAAAKLTKDNGAKAFFLVSSVGANTESSNFYLRIKGETERDVKAIGMEQNHIFRPSLLTGQRRGKRFLEEVSEGILAIVNPLLIGGLRRYRSIPAASVARAMSKAAKEAASGNHIYYWDDIKKLA